MDEEDKIESVRNKYSKIPHYHGDIIRKLFITGAIIMVGTLPFLNHRLPTSPFISILAIIIITSTAGFVSPKGKPVIILDFVISIGSVFIWLTEVCVTFTFKISSVTDIIVSIIMCWVCKIIQNSAKV